MKILKIGFILSAISLFLLSCTTTAQTTSAIKSVSYTHTFGRGGSTSITATPDSLESVARGGRTQEFPNVSKKINAKDWQNLVSGINVSTLDKTQSGERRGVYDGPDQIFRIVTKEKEYETALNATKILFGKSTAEDFENLNEETFLEIFDGVPQKELAKSDLLGSNIVDLISEKSGFLKSKGEAKRELAGNAISVNKTKVGEDFTVSESDLIDGKFLLLQKGKKNYFIVKGV